jgi:hypothetical protein
MKRSALILTLVFVFSYVILAQTVIENPEKPKNKNAGRIVRLEEMMRIRDDGVEVIFKAPYGLQIGHDGSIYLYDDWRIYKFSNEGKFVFKIIKPGQGPGEAIRRTNYLLIKNEIIIQAINPPKIMWFDFLGNFKGEKRTELTRTFDFVGFSEDKIYGFLDERPDEAFGKGEFVDRPQNLYEITDNFTKLNKKYSFPIKYYVIRSAWWGRARLDFAFKDSENLFVTHPSEYKIIKFNIEENIVERIFSRKYDRVKYPQKKEKPPPDSLSPPPFKYYLDLSKLLVHKDQLLVITSTRDKQNRRLVDVYNMKGEYIDNFYLEFPTNITPRNFAYGTIVAKDGFIHTIDEHEDGYFSVAKYKFEY